MSSLRKIIDTVKSIRKAYRVTVKVLNYAEKAMSLYPIAEKMLDMVDTVKDRKKNA